MTQDATAIARGVRSGAVSAVETTAAALERASHHEHLNAFTRIDPDRALERAEAIDRAVAAGADPGPLAGVPIALKDIVDQSGIPTTAGSSFLRDPATNDAPVVERLEAAGAVIVGRTGLHEFAYGFSSENDWWGPVRNPWDPESSPGGSSGGSAAAVAAGITPIGIGTDTGGSVRVPAALCGVVGLKPTHGRVPLRGVFPLAASLDTVGPMTRTVADAALALVALAGHDPDDPWSRDHPVPLVEEVDPTALTVAVPHPWIDRTMAPEQASGLAFARAGLEGVGATVVDLDLPVIDARDLARHPGAYHEAAEVHRAWFEADPTRYGNEIRDRLAAVLHVTQTDIESARTWRRRMIRAFEDAFERCDVILTPVTAARSKPIGRDTIDVGDGPEPYRPVLSWFTPLVNQAGLPALALPMEDPGVPGLPPSIQLVGPAWSEAMLLGTGLILERSGLVSHRLPSRVAPQRG